MKINRPLETTSTPCHLQHRLSKSIEAFLEAQRLSSSIAEEALPPGDRDRILAAIQAAIEVVQEVQAAAPQKKVWKRKAVEAATYEDEERLAIQEESLAAE